MKYYITKKIDATFEQAIDRVKESLGIEGFGVLSEINLHDKFKEKLNVDFRRYTILGACNPAYAYKAVQSEDKIGTMLPCNVVVQDLGKNVIEVTAVDPVASMMAIDNPKLAPIAEEVKRKLTRAIESLHNGVESFGLV
jgi:uncharacterized protein (DUF302 family)